MGCEFKEQLLQLGGFSLRGEPADSFGEDGGVDLFAVLGDEGVAELVDEAHGEEGAGVEGAGGIGVGPAHFVQRVGQLPARRHVGEDDVARIAKQEVVDLGCFANGAGDVEFHSRPQ